MSRRSFQLWLALASCPLVLATACQGPPPTTTGKPSGTELTSTFATSKHEPASAKTYEVQAKAFKMPKRIWVRGKRYPIPPPAPLRLKRKLMAASGYPVTTVAQGSLFTVPCDLDFDKDKNAYVANLDFDTGLGGIVKIAPDNQASFFSSQPGISMDADVTGTKLAAAAIRFIEDTPGLTNQLATFQLPSASPTFVINALGNYNASLPPGPVPLSMATWSTLWDAAYDNAGNLLVVDADEKYNAIRRIDRTTSQVDVVASLGASSLSVAPSGVIYCTVGNAIWSITPDGETHLLAGTGEEGFSDGPGATASFRLPNKVVYGDDGYLYVADSGNCAIRRVSLQGEVTTIAGNGTAGNADGNGTDATFNFPIGLRYGPDGNLYVADSFNNSLRRIELPKGGDFFVSDPTNPDDRSGAFSPNGDTRKDTLNLNITATSAWKVTTLNQAGSEVIVKEGVGASTPQVVNWDGNINGTKLRDGKYSLRLKSGTRESIQEVTIDTKRPKIEGLAIESIRYTSSTKLDYTVQINATDGAIEKSSGLDLSHVTISTNDSEINGSATLVNQVEGRYQAHLIIEPPQVPEPALKYTVMLRDNAGNFHEKKETFSMRVNYSGTANLHTLATNPGGYSLLATKKNKPFFYNNGERRFSYDFHSQLQSVKNGVLRSVPSTTMIKRMIVVSSLGTTRSTPKTPKMTWLRDPLPSNDHEIDSALEWNGRFENSHTGAVAPSGKYRVNVITTYESCGCDQEATKQLNASGITYGVENLEGFSVINNDDGLRWGESRTGTKEEVTLAFNQFKDEVGGSGGAFSWHHIVEKQNAYQGQLVHIDQVNSTYNLVRVHQSQIHKYVNYTKQQARNNLLKPFQELWDIGLARLVQTGWSYPMQEMPN